MRTSRALSYARTAILIVAAVYTLIPLLTIALTVLRSPTDLQNGPFTWPREFSPGTNLANAWVGGRFSSYLANSVIQTLPSVVIVIVTSTLAGFAFAKSRFQGRDLLFSILLLGMMIPFQSVMIPQFFLFNRFGMIDTHWAVIMSAGVGGIPFGTFMMRSFFRGLPDQLLEAARLDGCSELQAFIRVFMPIASPAWVALFIFQSMWSWNNFMGPLVYLFDDSLRPLPLGLMYFSSRYSSDYTLVAAGVLITIFPLLILYVVLQRKFVSSITMGALSG